MRPPLPYDDGAFDLVTLANMIPFFDELARVTAPGGALVFSFSGGAETPIYVPSARLAGRARAAWFLGLCGVFRRPRHVAASAEAHIASTVRHQEDVRGAVIPARTSFFRAR